MIVHDESVKPVEVSVIRKPHLEHKSYVIVKNHVRELSNDQGTSSKTCEQPEGSSLSSGSKETEKQGKSRNKVEKHNQITSLSDSEEILTRHGTQIDENDLKELKSVYKKCKDVILKIETKYGHLLGLSEAGTSSAHNKRKAATDSSSEGECQCGIKKKIIYDEDGKESTVFLPSENHICVAKVKQSHKESIQNRNISIEYGEQELNLPDSLQELGNLLTDPNIEKTYRYKVIDKIRMLRQEYVNEIRFNKHSLIEKLKSNPSEVLDFKGTNLETIPGYL